MTTLHPVKLHHYKEIQKSQKEGKKIPKRYIFL